MLLSYLIFASFGSDPRKPPRQADIDFCKSSNVPLEPWNIGIISMPDDFPGHYVEAMNLFLEQSKQFVKVRNAFLSGKYPVNLALDIEFADTENFVAASLPAHYDRCGRPFRATIYWSIYHLRKTSKEFLNTFIHEVMHFMGGFNKRDAPYYFFFGKKVTRDVDEGLIYGYIKEVGNNFYAVSPGVLEEVHKINPNWIGAPMECEEINGIKYPSDHWHDELFDEQFGCDLMLPYDNEDPEISRITIAMINDFGWYEIDFERLMNILNPPTKSSVEISKKQ
jgi:hypothetical protein